MQQSIASVSLLVNDYDECIAFYTQQLSFEILADITLEQGKRWVSLAPKNTSGANIVLLLAQSPEQKQQVGNQAGGAVLLILQTDDFWRDYHAMQTKGVIFLESPRVEPYGTVVIFADLYGNKWDLIETSIA